MTNAEQVKKDGEALNEIMKNYTGEEGAHFGFIYKGGKRHISIGGRADLNLICIAEGIAKMIEITPGLDEKVIDFVSETAKDMLKDTKETKLQ